MSTEENQADDASEANHMLIQTNHGVTYPLVGLGRMKQQELADTATESTDTSPPRNTTDPNDRRSASTDTVKAIAS